MDLSQTFKLEPPVSKIEQSRLSLCDFLGVHMLSHEIAKSRTKLSQIWWQGPCFLKTLGEAVQRKELQRGSLWSTPVGAVLGAFSVSAVCTSSVATSLSMPDFNYFPGRNVCWLVCCYFPLHFFGGSRSSDVSWSQSWKSNCVNELRRHQVVRDTRLGRGLCTEDEPILGFVIKSLKESLYILSIDP